MKIQPSHPPHVSPASFRLQDWAACTWHKKPSCGTLQRLSVQSPVDMSDQIAVGGLPAMLYVIRANAANRVPPSFSRATFQTNMSQYLSTSAKGAKGEGCRGPL
jgi:hypothetical protein